MRWWAPCRWLFKAFSRSPGHLRTGDQGERLAQRWLKRRGYRTIGRNLRLGSDEIDLLMWSPDRKTLVIVEVKTRVLPQGSNAQEINPLDSMTPVKRARQVRAGRQLMRHPLAQDHAIRFDVVSVRLPERGRTIIEHYVSAFDQ